MAKTDTAPFRQVIGKSILLAASTSNAQGTITGHYGRIRVIHDGSGMVFLRTGSTPQTAVATTAGVPGDIPLAGGGNTETLDIPTDHDDIAVITASGTANVYITPGQGV